MQGNHNFQPELFVQIDYQALIPSYHILRRIDKVLDLSFVKQLTKSFYSDTQGRPSIDPEIFFRICILGYLYGIKSDRQLCDEIGMNIGYRWFVGLSMSDVVPDHSSLTRIRDRLGVGCFEAVFERVIEQCREAGLVEGKRIITDASLVEANASARKLERREQPTVSVEVQDDKQQSKEAVSQTAAIKREPVSNHSSKVDGDASSVEASASAKKLERREQPTATIAVQDNKQQSQGAVSQTVAVKREPVSNHASKVDGDVSSVEASASAQKLERPEQPAEAIEVQDNKQQSQGAVSQTVAVKREPVSNRTHVSKVDGDATLVNRPGYPRKLYHKVHYCIDAKSRVITDCHVTTGACHETNVITQRIQYQQERFGFPIAEVVADIGYSSGKNYKFFEEHQIRSYIPTAKCRRKRGKQVAHEGSFKYDSKQDIYTCQAGHALSPKHAVGATKYYHIKKAHCNNCQWQASCYLGKRHTGLYRNEHNAAIERVRRRQGGKVFKQRMIERSWKVEGLFGEAKEQHGMRRAKYRGSEKVQIQAFGIGITQNLKRLAVSLDFYFRWIRFQFTQRFLLLRYSFQG